MNTQRRLIHFPLGAALLALGLSGLAGTAQAFDGAGGISAANRFTCAIDADDSISCWGNNDYAGQVSGPDSAVGAFKAISVGIAHTCAIDADDSISCWGDDGEGRVSGPNGAAGAFKAISAGGSFTCAIDADDSISCWGLNGSGSVSGPDGAPGAFKAVSAGFVHTCAIDADDSIRCWGFDDNGQVSGPNGAPGAFKAISAGVFHTCAIDADDSIRCWGFDDDGQVSGPNGAPGAFKAISAGFSLTCAIDSGDSISCWGGDGEGQVSGPDGAAGAFKAISTGGSHICAIDADDSISCWGLNNEGQTSGPDSAAGAFGVPGGTIDNDLADLAIVKTGPVSVTIGDAIGYTLFISNNGPDDSDGIELFDTLPAGLAYLSSSTTQGSCSFEASTATLSCDLGALARGDNATVTVQTTADQAGTITNTASVIAYATLLETDPDTGNNASSATTAVSLRRGVLDTRAVVDVQLFGLRLQINYSATLKDELSGNPLSGRTVQFSAAGVPGCSATTNANGVATCAVSLKGLLSTVLGLGYTASFAGDSVYAPASDDGSLLSLR